MKYKAAVVLGVLLLAVLLLAISFAEAAVEEYYTANQQAVNKQYKLNLDYSFGKLALDSLSVVAGEDDFFNGDGLYAAELVSFNNTILKISFFGIPNEIWYETLNPKTGKIAGAGKVILNETKFTLVFPYYEKAAEINLYNQELELLLSVDVGKYSKLTEQEKELKKLLEEKKEKKAEKEIEIEPEEKEEMEEMEELKGKTILWLIIGGGILVVVLVMLINIVKRKREGSRRE